LYWRNSHHLLPVAYAYCKTQIDWSCAVEISYNSLPVHHIQDSTLIPKKIHFHEKRTLDDEELHVQDKNIPCGTTYYNGLDNPSSSHIHAIWVYSFIETIRDYFACISRPYSTSISNFMRKHIRKMKKIVGEYYRHSG
jgi:hypothetical protein